MSAFARREAAHVDVDGRIVRLTNLSRVLWPATGWTKGDMVDHYAKLAPALLPHLRERPITMWRFPEGVDREGWWQNECRGAPEWVGVYTYVATDGRTHRHCVIDDLATLLFVANLGTVEIHPFLFRKPAPDVPLEVVFDLDPGLPAGVLDAARWALHLRDVVGAAGLTSFAKTSGSKGMHVHVPLNEPHTFLETKNFARGIAGLLARTYPDEVTDRQARNLRAGKVMVDWLQNDAFRSTIVAYSLRATDEPRVATPVAWDEVEVAVERREEDLLAFGPDDVLRRLDRLGDLFEPVLRLRQRLPGRSTQAPAP
jgi:bifunctional non-homologous end joining protein LigD